MKKQRKLSKTIKRARHMGIYITLHDSMIICIQYEIMLV